jgi:hypothetical protein
LFRRAGSPRRSAPPWFAEHGFAGSYVDVVHGRDLLPVPGGEVVLP